MKITVHKDEELLNSINSVDHLVHVYGSISVEVAGQEIPKVSRYGIFLTRFFQTCISAVTDGGAAPSAVFSFEGPHELRFDSRDSLVGISLYRRNEATPVAEIEVDEDEFISEVARASEEYLSFVLNHRPEFEERSDATEFQESIDNLKVRIN